MINKVDKEKQNNFNGRDKDNKNYWNYVKTISLNRDSLWL